MRHVLRGTAPSFAFGALGLLCAGCAGDSSTGDDLAAPPAAAHGPEARGVLPGVTLPRSATRAPRTGAVAGSLRTVWSAARDHRRGATPSFGTGLPFERGGAFEMEGETAPGGATFDGAIVWDPESSEMPVTVGGGRFDVTIDGVAYARSDLQSFAAVMPEEETGAPFVLLAGL
ncbi:MAG: hypothetical protein IT379_07260, partial [Deltaproteobacteria bacterium]|nr:hypothetical protein [Deltaproteobacteria bacterium]